MTRAEAIAKVVKLRKLAESTRAEGEAINARKLAAEISHKHHLTEVDLSRGPRVAAMDDLLGRLDARARSHGDLPASVGEVVERLKKSMSDDEKVSGLEIVVGIVRVGSLFLGKSKIGPIKDIVEQVLRDHGVTV